ncbi:MAG TPA: bifunctional UDP-N-acetylglucosamine diphosphorylase/glucosamine-1-phosphate N-acetyltransferase GlmU [Candidatus Dormibacteraeota bacterium]|nr:bifunctional UDP-N-acetylglucosamine diphosphorylase/glucosamine-1-phosphate N-acetyltransferase GlmU [Candidatus Dormibacteraeota bacterium]
MARPELAVVILAAGKGTRLRSRRAKVLHRAGGRALVEHVIRAARPLGVPRFVVVGYQSDRVSPLAAALDAKTILQEPQGGTGHALQAARLAIEKFRRALVVPGDAPLVRTETLAALVQAHQASGVAATVLTAVLDDPSGYGRIVRGADHLVRAIVEDKAADAAQRAIREVNSGIYCFELEKLWASLGDLRPENVHRELYLTDVVALLNRKGERVAAMATGDAKEILGCNTRRELAEVDALFRRRKIDELMAAGVTVYLPETVLVDPDVEVGPDTVVEPGAELLGATRIGPDALVGAGCVIADSEIAEGVVIRPHSIVISSRVGRGAVVGPFAHLRDGAELGAGARVGNYVEMKKSRLGEGSKAMHLTYLGDASVGRETNIGAGTITCNYDGVRKNPTKIGSRVFIGSGTELVAPVEVGDGAYVAAGSTITDSVPSNALAIARARQENKPGWALRRRARIAAPESAPAPQGKPSPDPPRPKAKPSRAKPGRAKRPRAAKSRPRRRP